MKDGKNRNHLTEIEQEAEPALADGQIYQLLVIGGGPAGMAAALAAKKAGLEKIAILDRNQRWGGILPQCIHDGFGIYTYGETLTGPEYASRWYQNLQKEAIPYYCATTVIEICKKDEFFAVDYLGMVCGRGQIYGESIIFATGCRERTLGQMRIPGSRPAGIYTAGEAQYMINMQNYLPGRSIVILGSGDIGLIMARRCIMEGMKVKLILGEKSSGLMRNYLQCVKDNDIPLRFGWTILSVHGYQRLKGITIAPLGSDGRADAQSKEYIACDTLLLATGLIPEAELWLDLNQSMGEKLSLPIFDGDELGQDTAEPGISFFGATSPEGTFACGNIVKTYDLVDKVSQDGFKTGLAAACWLLQKQKRPLPDINIGDFLQKNIVAAEPRALDPSLLADVKENQIICIRCPQGCKIEITKAEDSYFTQGNSCSKGHDYAIEEFTAPKRYFTGTVVVNEGIYPLVSVRTDQPVAKSKLKEIMEICRKMKVMAPIEIGELLLPNIADSGGDLLSTCSCPKQFSGQQNLPGRESMLDKPRFCGCSRDGGQL